MVFFADEVEHGSTGAASSLGVYLVEGGGGYRRIGCIGILWKLLPSGRVTGLIPLFLWKCFFLVVAFLVTCFF